MASLYQSTLLRILALKDPDQVAANALRLVGEGYQYLKIKLDNAKNGLDVTRVAAVREAVGPGIHLTLDANQSYSPRPPLEAVSFRHAVWTILSASLLVPVSLLAFPAFYRGWRRRVD